MIGISAWFIRHTIRPLFLTSSILVGVALLLIGLVISVRQSAANEAVVRFGQLAEMAMLQKNRPFIEYLADLGQKDMGMEAVAICGERRPIFLFPESVASCDLKPSWFQILATHKVSGRSVCRKIKAHFFLVTL